MISLSFQTLKDSMILSRRIDFHLRCFFEKSWALTVLERTMDRLEADMAHANKQQLYEHLKV